MASRSWVLIGGAGFVGSAVARRLLRAGDTVTVVDRTAPTAASHWIDLDLLTDDIDLPPGHVVVLAGTAEPRAARPWSLIHRNVFPVLRLLPALADRDVTLVSSGEVYGAARGPLREDSALGLPIDVASLDAWCAKIGARGFGPCAAWQVASECRDLACYDPGKRWVYALSKRAQEILAESQSGRLRVLRLGNVIGRGQERFPSLAIRRILDGIPLQVTAETLRSFTPVEEVGRVVEAILPPGTYNVAAPPISLDQMVAIVSDEVGRAAQVTHLARPADDHCGELDASLLRRFVPEERSIDDHIRLLARSFVEERPPMFQRPLEVVIPPKPEEPDTLVERTMDVLRSGKLKRGGRWTTRLEDQLHALLGLSPDLRVVATSSGTAALRLAVVAALGPRRKARPVALVPAFTFAATGECLEQLGCDVVFVDVDKATWNIDPVAVAQLLATEEVDVVVAVDAFGAPADYDALSSACCAANVPLIADSAAGLGSLYQGRPVGGQAFAHAFSMSFAKVISAGGAGGFLVVPATADLERDGNWMRSSAMTESAAVVALDQLDHLDELVSRREAVAAVYNDVASVVEGLVPQAIKAGDRHCYVHWVCRITADIGREGVARRLLAENIETKPYFYPPLWQVTSGRVANPPLAVTEQLTRQTLALPMSSEISTDQARLVATALVAAVKDAG